VSNQLNLLLANRSGQLLEAILAELAARSLPDGAATEATLSQLLAAVRVPLEGAATEATLNQILVGLGTWLVGILAELEGKLETSDLNLDQDADLQVDVKTAPAAVSAGLIFYEAYNSSELHIYSLCEYDGSLYAGGGEGGKVFVFDGATWTESYDSDEEEIRALGEYAGLLFAGSSPGGKVFYFDGANWEESYDSSEDAILCLCEYDGDLYAGSHPGGKVFVFDAVTWSESYDSSEAAIFCLCEYDGKLFAGSGSGGKVFVFDGATWVLSYDSSESQILCLCEYGGLLFAGSGEGGKVFVFDGATWTESYDSYQDEIVALWEYNGKLYAGSNPGGKCFVFDGATWAESYDLAETYIWALCGYSGRLYAGTGGSTDGKVFEGYEGILAPLASEAKLELVRALLESLLELLDAKDFSTETTLAALLAELELKADLAETQPVSVATLPTVTAQATGGDKLFSFGDVLLDLVLTGNAVAGANMLTFTAVPAGKVQFVTGMAAYNNTSACTQIILGVLRSGVWYWLDGVVAPGVNDMAILRGQMNLAAGDQAGVAFQGCALGDDLYAYLNALQMDAPS
jgi:outer membrane protein assembly factor BamB